MVLKRRWGIRALAPALALLGLCIGRAQATGSPLAALNIDVTISASVSVQVDGAASSSYTTSAWSSPNHRIQPAILVAQVTNNSSGLSEQWWLSTNPTSINTVGNPRTWSLVVSTNIADVGADSFAVQAVFISSASSSCPFIGAAVWNSTTTAPALSTVPALYTSTRFADSEYGGNYAPETKSNSTVWAYNSATGNGLRGICWFVTGPASSVTPDRQNIQVIVTAVQGS